MNQRNGGSRGGWPIVGPELTQRLTENFHFWELRGRGWQVAEYPVELEPPFEPFYHFQLTQGPPIDDSRKPTFLSSLADMFSGSAGKPKEVQSYEVAEPSEMEPEPYGDDSPILEFRLVLPAKQKVTLDIMEALLLNLSSCAFPLSFELIGTHEATTVQLAC